MLLKFVLTNAFLGLASLLVCVMTEEDSISQRIAVMFLTSNICVVVTGTLLLIWLV